MWIYVKKKFVSYLNKKYYVFKVLKLIKDRTEFSNKDLGLGLFNRIWIPNRIRPEMDRFGSVLDKAYLTDG